ncbi:MAG: lysylphosphatidylglycerol synthase domain-containing protein [Gemmatimonadota bacterium]
MRYGTALRTVAVRLGQLALIVLVSYGIIRALAPEIGKISARDLEAWTPNAGVIAIALLLLVTVYLMHYALWRAITTRLGGASPAPRAALRMYFVSSLGRYVPGKLWQIAGLAVLAQKAGISPVAATAASLAGQFAFLTSGLVYLAALLPGWGGRAPLIGAVVLIVTGCALFLFFTSNARHWLSERFDQRFSGALALLDRISWRAALAWWFAYALTWALLGVAFVVFVRAFVPLEGTQYIHVAGTIAAAYLFGYVFFFSLAGLGIREAAMIGLLNQVMPASAALVVSVASRLWFTAAELLPLALIPVAKDE